MIQRTDTFYKAGNNLSVLLDGDRQHLETVYGNRKGTLN